MVPSRIVLRTVCDFVQNGCRSAAGWFVDLKCETVCGDGAGGSPRRNSTMRFMYFVIPAHPTPPTPELMEAIHKLADREIKAGRMLDTGGLMPLATGAQVRIKDGEL